MLGKVIAFAPVENDGKTTSERQPDVVADFMQLILDVLSQSQSEGKK